jgi:hypothetical protein
VSRLAVIGTFYRRYENTYPLSLAINLSTRLPDELWLMAEEVFDADHLAMQEWLVNDEHRVLLPTPRVQGGRYAVIPYSHKINYALDRTTADYVVYLDNGSMPHRDKYRLMAAALDEHPEWGAVYCGQRRTGYAPVDAHADGVVADAYCRLNYTQVMHRRTDDRWTLDMRHADPDLADALFWRSLHASLGAFYPVAPGLLLDEHHIESAKAAGL